MQIQPTRKQSILDHADRIAPERDRWIARNFAYYSDDRRYMRFLIPPKSRVLDLGYGTGDLLFGLDPSVGIGIDLSSKMVEICRRKYPHLDFRVGDAEDERFIKSLTAAHKAGLCGDEFKVRFVADAPRFADRKYALVDAAISLVV